MPPYERLLGDAMRGDRTLFGSEEGVEAAWRIVDAILTHDQSLVDYEPGTTDLQSDRARTPCGMNTAPSATAGVREDGPSSVLTPTRVAAGRER
jgi:hypothetical protein